MVLDGGGNRGCVCCAPVEVGDAVGRRSAGFRDELDRSPIVRADGGPAGVRSGPPAELLPVAIRGSFQPLLRVLCLRWQLHVCSHVA
eukprot:1888524-Heterocapsa_arctica.AAC.1